MYKKRQTIKNFWPISRKGTKYVTRASHEKERAIPLMIVFRDILGLVENKKELKRLLKKKEILINNKVIKEVNYPVLFFDVLSIPKIKKHYRAVYSKFKKMVFEEVDEKGGSLKTYKVVGKRKLKGGRTQINLSDGENVLYEKKIDTGDSIVLNTKEKSIEKILKMKKGVNIIVIKGKYLGEVGEILRVYEKNNKKLAEIKLAKKRPSLELNNIIAVE